MLHRVLLLMLLHVLVLVGGRMLLFLLADRGLILVGPLVLLHVVLLVLRNLPMLFRGQMLMLLMVGRGLHQVVLLLLPVVVVLMLLVMGVLHVRFLHMMAMVFGRLMLYFLADIEMPLVGRPVALLFVL
jgi:hypothetical protein